jgi:hypothetical protein
MLFAIVQTLEKGRFIHSLVLPECISDCQKYTLYPRATHQKSSQPVYSENSKFLSNRNPKSDWLEYGLVSFLNPNDLSKLFNCSLHHKIYFPLLLQILIPFYCQLSYIFFNRAFWSCSYTVILKMTLTWTEKFCLALKH